MTILFLLLTCLLPIALGLIISWIDKKKRGTVRHGLVLTLTVLFGVIICWIAAIADPERTWWRYAVPSVACYWAFYPIVINRLLLNVNWNYIGTTSVYDRIEGWFRNKVPFGVMLVLFLKAVGLMIGAWAWVYGSIY